MPGGRPKSQVWQLFDEHADGVKCKRCPAAIVNPKPLKLESHLAKCSGYTLLEKNKRKHVSEEREEERVRRNSRDNGAAVTLSPSGDGSATLQGVSQAEMEMRIANFVYESGSAFRIVELPSFTFMMNGANPVLTIPSAKKVGDELLTASFEQHTEKKYLVLQKDHAFVAVAFDGWSNLKREEMINVVASSPNMGVVHIKMIAVGFDSQTGKYIDRLMIREIGELEDVIGPGKVASCTTDNAGNMEKALEILEKRGIFCNGCAAHTFNLLLHDVAKLDEVKAVAAGAEAITAYFVGRHTFLS